MNLDFLIVHLKGHRVPEWQWQKNCPVYHVSLSNNRIFTAVIPLTQRHPEKNTEILQLNWGKYSFTNIRLWLWQLVSFESFSQQQVPSLALTVQIKAAASSTHCSFPKHTSISSLGRLPTHRIHLSIFHLLKCHLLHQTQVSVSVLSLSFYVTCKRLFLFKTMEILYSVFSVSGFSLN